VYCRIKPHTPPAFFSTLSIVLSFNLAIVVDWW